MNQYLLQKEYCQIKKERVLVEHRLYLLYRYITCKYLFLEPCLTFENCNLRIEMNGALGDSIRIEPHHTSSHIQILDNGLHGGVVDETKRVIDDLKIQVDKIESIESFIF